MFPCLFVTTMALHIGSRDPGVNSQILADIRSPNSSYLVNISMKQCPKRSHHDCKDCRKTLSVEQHKDCLST